MSESTPAYPAPPSSSKAYVLKECHWCSKKEERGGPLFQFCGRCKMAAYCSKECQRSSWKLHKDICKQSAAMFEKLPPTEKDQISLLKEWSSQQQSLLRNALVSALDLRNHPENIDKKVGFLEVKLRADAEHLPLLKKFEIVGGFDWEMDQFKEILVAQKSESVFKSYQAAHAHTIAKGGLGIGIMMLKLGNISDVVQVTMPSAAACKALDDSQDWGVNWVNGIQLAIEQGYRMVPKK